MPQGRLKRRRGALWQEIVQRAARALEQGALQPIATEQRFLEEGGVRFVVRKVSSLALKADDQAKRANPFLPYDPELFVAEASGTHLYLLNKFNVIDHHLLIVTRAFQHQETLLTVADFEALWACLATFPGLGFYNGGKTAGASQAHKHLQIVPLPLSQDGRTVPIEALIERERSERTAQRIESLPFRNAFCWLSPVLARRPLAAAEQAHERYHTLLGAAGLHAIDVDGETRQSAPYNLLITREWMLLIPRSEESFDGISVNALGFAGSLFVRDEAALKTVAAHGPMTILQHVGVAEAPAPVRGIEARVRPRAMARTDVSSPRRALLGRLDARLDALVDLTRRLVRVPSENPPGDTSAIVALVADVLREVDGAEVTRHSAEAPIVNLVARIQGNGPGRRLVFNGHLDTYPAGDRTEWSHDPFGGAEADGRLYGRGVADMKGGIACSLEAFMLLAECRDAWPGELVVTLAGDEETMGRLGTQYLLDTVPHAAGEAMICGDAGAPEVPRFGEKGMIWLDLVAEGRVAHGAHVHLGESAIDRLRHAMDRLARLRRYRVTLPSEVANAIRKAKPISEALAGRGEVKVLRSVTVNFGQIEGGSAPNLVADRARATADIRLPPGATVAEIEAQIRALLEPLDGIACRIERRYEPNWTDPGHEIVQRAASNCEMALGRDVAVNLRVGASDARLYRLAGIPSVVCGLTPHNMGGPNEYIRISELHALARIHTLTAFDFLTAGVGDIKGPR